VTGYPSFGLACPACGIAVEDREGGVCWVPGCPCFRLDPASTEALNRARDYPAFAAETSAGRSDARLSGTGALRMQAHDAVTARQIRDGLAMERREMARRATEERYAALDNVTDADSALRWLAAHKSVNAHGR